MIRTYLESVLTGLEAKGWVACEMEDGGETISAPMEARFKINDIVGVDAGSRPGRLLSVNVDWDLRVRKSAGIEGELDSLEAVESALGVVTSEAQASTGHIKIKSVKITAGDDYRGAVVSCALMVSV
jgi:hypothetical protein